MSPRLAALFLALLLAAAAPRAGEPLPASPEEAEEEARVIPPEDLPAPLLRAEVGDWASYATATGGLTRITVAERWEQPDGDVLLVLEIADKPPKRKRARIRHETISVRERVADQRDLGINDTISAGELLFRGRQLPVFIVNFMEGGEVIRRSYFSDSVPIYGLVRGVNLHGGDQTVSLSLQDFGFAEESMP